LTLQKQLARAAKGEISVYDAYVFSAMEAREASVDFNRAGELGRTYNAFFAFFNASVQGSDKFNRTFFKDSGKGKAWLRGISLITMPSLLLWAINHDEDWYKDLDRYKKNSFWFFSPDHGKTIWFYPKPFEVGMVFGSLPERMCDEAFRLHPEQMSAWSKQMLQNLNPIGSPVPIMWSIIQAASNHDFRMGRPVIPRGLETVEARYQYDENTSEFSKVLGDMIPTKGGKGVSPKAIDFVIRGGAGGLGRYFTDLASAAIILFDPKRYREKPEVPKAFIPLFNTSIRTDIPLLRAFVVAGPNRNPESIEKFYDFLGESQEAVSTLAELGKQGRAKADIPDYIRRRGMWLVLAEQLEARGRQMSEINSEIRAYQKDDGHLGTPQERSVEIDRRLEFRTEQARQAVSLVEELRSDPDAMIEMLDRAAAEVEDALARQEALDQLLRGN
jgi:hypothetical protein